jgi:fructosamine-3-kinase
VNDFAPLAAAIAAATGQPFRITACHTIAGGSRWRTFKLDNERTGKPASVFIKWGAQEHAPVFAAEVDGLASLASAESGFRIPRVLHQSHGSAHAALVLEWIDLEPLDEAGGARAGRALAELHRDIGDTFGWPRDNFIGATPQINTPGKGWVEFFQHHRLLCQLDLAKKNRFPSRLIERGERLVADLPALFRSYAPVASLLHGDTWIGNVAQDAHGMPVIFDPAVHRGDREADVAMTELFGGFPRVFFTEYANAWPLDDDYAARKQLYQIYHLLNHANLFAGDYVKRSEQMIERVLAQVR